MVGGVGRFRTKVGQDNGANQARRRVWPGRRRAQRIAPVRNAEFL